MPLQFGALRDALIDAGAKPEKASAAAEEVAAYRSRCASIEGRLNTLTWMVGTCLALVLLLVGGEMVLWAKLGEISGQLDALAHGTH